MIVTRHMVYGLYFLEKFRGMVWRKFYLIFALTDETYALLSSTPIPEGMERSRFYLAVSLLNQMYWVAGTLIGCIVGFLIPFDLEGVEFAMTALFTVIAVEQCRNPAAPDPVPDRLCCAACFAYLVRSGRNADPRISGHCAASSVPCGRFWIRKKGGNRNMSATNSCRCADYRYGGGLPFNGGAPPSILFDGAENHPASFSI